MKNNKKYMSEQEYIDLINKSRKDAYELTIDELENQLDVGFELRRDAMYDGDYKMAHKCSVILGTFEEVFEERTKVVIRNKKIDKILSEEEDDDEWWVI